MNSLFHATFPSWYLFKKLSINIFTQDVADVRAKTCCYLSLYFWKSAFSFRADSIWKSDGDFISN